MSLPNESISALLGGDSGYQIERSLRFNSTDSAYLNRTPASASGYDQWTFSCWFKRLLVGENLYLIGGNTTTSGNRNELIVTISSSDELSIWAFTNSSGYYFNRFSQSVYRDPSAWYHLVVQFDPDNGTSANKIIAYMNGVQVTWRSSADSGAAGSIGSSGYRSINNTYRNDIGGGYQGGGAPVYFTNAYMTEIHMVSGSIVAPSSFGETDTITGVWNPIEYTGTYGTNGFYLNFADNSNTTAATLGKDSSGNGNNWTPNNFSVTVGAGEDSMIDTPTSNYCTLNPLDKIPYNGSASISNGNLEWVGDTTGGTANGFAGSIAVNSGKWYWETAAFDTGVSFAPEIMSGIISGNIGSSGFEITDSYKFYYNRTTSLRRKFEGTAYVDYSSYYGGFTSGDIWMIAFDANSGKLWYGKNGSWYSNASGAKDPATGINPDSSSIDMTKTWRPAVASYTSQASGKINFGQRTFAYTPPSGFLALNTQNLPTPAIAKGNTVMDVVLYTGTGAALTPTSSLGFNPDWIWIKSRSATTDHAIYDVVSGAQERLESNTTDFEVTSDNGVTAFNSAGFTLGTLAQVNTSSATYVAWCWDAGTSTVSNTAGSITSQVRTNASAGFSIVSYTGNGTSSQTVGHGLGVAPSMVIVKNRDRVASWLVRHSSLPANQTPLLENVVGYITTNYWESTYPSSTVFTISNNSEANANNENLIAYCFSEVAGFSKFGSYTGNGSSDGSFVHCGFRPRWVMIKRTDSAQNWPIVDSSRDTYNIANKRLFANLNSNEDTGIPNFVDILSNGFKCRDSNVSYNASGGNYIFISFAENPFKYSLAR